MLPPPVPGIGTAGGFRMMVEDRAGHGPAALRRPTASLMARANQTPGLSQVFTLFETSTPQVYLDIDRTKAQLLGINVQRRVQRAAGLSSARPTSTTSTCSAAPSGSPRRRDGQYRQQRSRCAEDPRAQCQRRHGAARLLHHGARHLRARTACRATISIPPPNSTARPRPAIRRARPSRRWKARRRDACRRASPPSGPTLAFQQIRAGNTATFAFVLAVVFVFLVLAAQYESLTLPLAVILIVPMCLLAAITGVILRGMDNNILTQIGFVVLIGLAAKNAILIVEFARQLEDEGRSRWEAAVEAARTRLRPILMTSFAFILGVAPLAWAIGAGAELRQALGTAVFFGMIGVTVFGLIFTPVFYVFARWIAEIGARRGKSRREPRQSPAHPAD